MNIKKLAISAVMVLALTGCQTLEQQAEQQARYNRWYSGLSEEAKRTELMRRSLDADERNSRSQAAFAAARYFQNQGRGNYRHCPWSNCR